MNSFQSYTTKQLINICSSDSMISKLNKKQLSLLLNELEHRRRDIEDKLSRMGVPGDAIRDPRKRQSFKRQFNQLVDLLGDIEKIIE